MQTTETKEITAMIEIRDRALKASAYKEKRLVAKGYSLTVQDVQWIKGLAMCLNVSESQIMRGILARARALEIEFADEREETYCPHLPPVDR